MQFVILRISTGNDPLSVTRARKQMKTAAIRLGWPFAAYVNRLRTFLRARQNILRTLGGLQHLKLRFLRSLGFSQLERGISHEFLPRPHGNYGLIPPCSFH